MVRSILIALIICWANVGRAEGYSHDYINSTRSGAWLIQQNYNAVYGENYEGKAFQSGAGTEFFGFWRNSITSYIYHVRSENDFTYGYGLGLETQLVFKSPIFNIGLIGGCSANSYTVPTQENDKYESAITYGGLMLERFWSYQLSYGVTAKSLLERYSPIREPENLVSVGAFTNLWNK